MKRTIISLIVLLTSHAGSSAGWFSGSEETRREHDQRVQAEAQKQVVEAQRTAAETQLIRQQQATSHWQTIAVILGMAAPVLLIAGAALGAKARRHDQQAQ